MRACVRRDSVWIGVRWSRDYGKDACSHILAELVHLEEPPTSMGPESVMDYVRRAVWGMVYAVDACKFWRSSQGFT